MSDTATPETGPVDAPASVDSIIAEIEGGNSSPNGVDAIVDELVNETESDGSEPSQEEPAAEGDATEPAEEAGDLEEGPPDEEQRVTVKVNGEDREVPLSEALAGYSRLEDYKAKTAEVATLRRDLEAKAATIEADVKSHYADQLEQMATAFEQFDPVLMEARKINWEELKATDLEAFVQASDAVHARIQQLEQMKQQVATAREQTQEQHRQQEAGERNQRFDKAGEEIVKAMPELADEARFEAFANGAITHLQGEGFTREEIANTLDHRVLRLADDARQWRAHKAAQQSLPQKKVVQKSAIKPLVTDGEGSRASKPRPPRNASRDQTADWAIQQLISET